MRQKPGKRREAIGNRKSEPIARAEGRYANGDVDCPAMHKRIDNTICVLFSWRYPKSCEGCKYRRKA